VAAMQAVKFGSDDPDFLLYVLCKEFGWLPSEAKKEDWYTIWKFGLYTKYKNSFEKAALKR
jgi:hypothetical protein